MDAFRNTKAKNEMQIILTSPRQMDQSGLTAALAQDAMAQGVKNPLWFGFPTRLLLLRQAADMSVARLASFCRLTHPAICNAENRINVPRVSVVERMAYALGVSPTWLAFGHDGEQAFSQRIRRSLLRVQRDPRPGTPQPCPESYRGLPQRLQESRERLGLSLRALALAAGLSGPGVAKIEHGESVPTLDNVEALAKALGVSPGWLAFGVGRGPDGKRHRAPAAVA